MRHVRTSIDIQAPASLVWAILADFGTYWRWNPLIRGVQGRSDTGAQIHVRLRSPGGDDVSVRSTIGRSNEPRELRWHDQWKVPGMFRAERRFRIEALPAGGVRFHHAEQAGGVLASLLTQRRQMRSTAALQSMNSALKLRAERAHANIPAAAR